MRSIKHSRMWRTRYAGFYWRVIPDYYRLSFSFVLSSRDIHVGFSLWLIAVDTWVIWRPHE